MTYCSSSELPSIHYTKEYAQVTQRNTKTKRKRCSDQTGLLICGQSEMRKHCTEYHIYHRNHSSNQHVAEREVGQASWKIKMAFRSLMIKQTGSGSWKSVRNLYLLTTPFGLRQRWLLNRGSHKLVFPNIKKTRRDNQIQSWSSLRAVSVIAQTSYTKNPVCFCI